DGIRDGHVTGVQTCALPIYKPTNPVSTTVATSHAKIWPVNRRQTLQMLFRLGLCSLPPFPLLLPAKTGSEDEYFQNYVDVALQRSEERRVGKEGKSLMWTVQ